MIKLVDILKEIKVRPKLNLDFSNIDHFIRATYLGNSDKIKDIFPHLERGGPISLINFGQYYGYPSFNPFKVILFNKKYFRLSSQRDAGLAEVLIERIREAIQSGDYEIID